MDEDENMASWFEEDWRDVATNVSWLRHLRGRQDRATRRLDLASRDAELADLARRPGNLQVVDASSVPPDEFARRFVATGMPCVVRGLTDAWPAVTTWKKLADVRGDVPHRVVDLVSAGGKPHPVRVPLGAFARYAVRSRADWPIYAFGDDFKEERAILAADYAVPAHFSDEHGGGGVGGWVGGRGPCRGHVDRPRMRSSLSLFPLPLPLPPRMPVRSKPTASRRVPPKRLPRGGRASFW